MMKDYNLKRHYESRHEADYRHLIGELREKAITKLRRELVKQQEIIRKPVTLNESVVKASYVISQNIAEKLKPFTEGEFVKKCMTEAAEILTPDKKKLFEMISLTRNTVASRIQDMGNNIAVQLANRTAKSFFFTLAIDESTDITDTGQLSIFIRGISSDLELFEDLLALWALYNTTKGFDIAEVVMKVVSERIPGVQWSQLAGITTDGAPSMTGKENGAAALIKKHVHLLNPEQVVLTIHCIIYQEALCRKALKMDHVMDAVVKVVNEIRAKGLKYRQFQAFLEELDTEYKDLLYHCEVRWLSRGKVLERFFVLREEIMLFLMKKTPNLKEKGGNLVTNLMSEQDWLLDLAFLVDLTPHLNILNTKMQGRNQLLTVLLEHVRAFQTKITLFRNQFEQGKFIHFRSMSSLLEKIKMEPTSYKRYVDLLDVLMENFSTLTEENGVMIFFATRSQFWLNISKMTQVCS